jgi:DNA-binding CsgD family transcriptional regulator
MSIIISLKEIIELREQGLRNKEIASKLGVSTPYIGNQINKLIKQGRIKRRRNIIKVID